MQVIVDFLLHVLHGVVFGENLYAEVGRRGEDLTLELRALDYRHIWHSYPSGTDLNAHSREDLDSVFPGASREIDDHPALSRAVRSLTQISLDDPPVHKFAIGMIARV